MIDVAREALHIFSRRGGRFLSGAVAFYALLSMVPLLVISVRVAAFWVSERAVHAVLHAQVETWVGAEGARVLDELLRRAGRSLRTGAGSVLSVLVLLYASTRLFSHMKRALEVLWDVPQPEVRGLRRKVLLQIHRRALALLLVLFVSLVLLALVATQAVIAGMHHVLGASFAAPILWHLLEAVVSFSLTVVLFGLLFRVLPDAAVALRDLAIGATVTAALFTLGSSIVGLYVGHKATASIYGAASSVVMLLLWVHYSAQVFFLGAAYTAAHARLYGRGIVPRVPRVVAPSLPE